jgi:predicted nucleotidyltransferase
MANKSDSASLDRLVEELRAAHGENLVSIVLYGSSAAGGEVRPGSDHNLLVVLNRIAAGDLRADQKAVAAWLKKGEPPPVYFTVEELQRAVDVFPIEFTQMEKARKVLFGRDALEFVQITRANLRHQTEYELRTKLIQLRRLFVPASASVERLAALMSESLASFAALFRAVLILHGHEPPIDNPGSVRATVNSLGLNGAPFDRILELRSKGATKLTQAEADALFTAYMEEIERVIEAVDRIK